MILTTTAQNYGQRITAAEIHALLDQNPSYSQMCENLEGRGFVIDRGDFARFLLSAVPDVAAPPVVSATPRSDPPAFQHPPNEYATPHSLPPTQGQLGHNIQRQPDGGQVPNPQQVFVSDITSGDLDAVDQSLPITKEGKARKRNFSDIVDLTQALSDDEDFERHRPKSRIDQVWNTRNTDSARMKVSKTGTSTPSGGERTKSDGSRAKPSGRDPILSERVVVPMNPKRDALRRSTYDPKTIARDILISSGRHPTMAPLNHHLDVLRERFTSVNHESDLSTFRWDIVDAVKKSPREIRGPAPEVLDQDADEEDVGGKTPSRVPSKQNPPKTAPFKPASAQRETPMKRRGRPRKHPNPEAKADKSIPTMASTGEPPWELIESRLGTNAKAQGPKSGVFKLPPKAGDPKLTTKQQMLALQAPKTTRNPESGLALINSFAFTPVATSAASFTPVANPTPKPPTTEHVSSARKAALSSPLPPPVKKPSKYVPTQKVVNGRKGRPPGAKNKQPRSDKGILKGAKKRLSSGTPTNSLATRPSEIDSIPRRSSGLRNVMSPTAGFAVVIQSRSPSVAGGGSGAFKTENTAPAYGTYECGWKDCPAELHNVETLRKHLRKHRKGLEKPLPCKWAECSGDAREDDGVEWPRFKDEVAWDRHVEKKHVRAVAKRQGNVLGGNSDEDSSDRSTSPTQLS